MCLENVDVAILCGGKGTRIRHILGDTPKILAQLKGRPYIEWLVDKLREHGATRIVLVGGFLAAKIQIWLDSKPRPYKVGLILHVEPEQKGPTNAIREVSHLLLSDEVLTVNGDTIMDIDYCRLLESHRQHKAAASVAVDRTTIPVGSNILSQWAIDHLDPRVEPLERALFIACDMDHPYNIIAGAPDFIDFGTPEGYAKAQT